MTTALLAYLTELDGYRRTCLAHGRTASIGDEQGLPCIRRSSALLDAIRRSAAAIPGWRASPFFRTGQREWKEIQVQAARRGHAVVLCLGLTYEGFPFLLRVTGSRTVVTVDLVPLPYPADWPEHPLRLLDRVLRCHDRLLPDGVRPFAVSGRRRCGWESVERCGKRFVTRYAGPGKGRQHTERAPDEGSY